MSVPLLAAIAFLPQGQTAKKVTMTSSCNKAHKDKTMIAPGASLELHKAPCEFF
jgi:hypothetical protein